VIDQLHQTETTNIKLHGEFDVEGNSDIETKVVVYLHMLQFNFNGKKVTIVDTNGSAVADDTGDTTKAKGNGRLTQKDFSE